MNTGSNHTYESQFGPPSELIHVGTFITTAFERQTDSTNSVDLWNIAPEHVQSAEILSDITEGQIEMECNLDEIHGLLDDVMKVPHPSAYARRNHEASVSAIYENAKAGMSNRRKRKRTDLESATDTPELTALKDNLDNIQLQSWLLTQDAALFIRGPMHHDQNALSQLKKSEDGVSASPCSALLTVTVHNRIAWSHSYITRFSQHAILSSQTLGDLFEVIPCSFNELPQELYENGRFVGYVTDQNMPPSLSSGCVICIEGIAYGDGSNEVDYADKLIEKLSPGQTSLKNGPKMHDTPLSSLSLRLHEPYWFVHEGDCEHFLEFNQIRLLHPGDPPVGYPLTLQITPPLLNICRACTKVPAVYSIVGDVRLGESPCVLCAPCWRNMGPPNGPNSERVIIVPLLKHKLGW